MNECKREKNSTWWKDISEENLWYLIGLVTSDGSLSIDGRHIDITAKEEDFLKDLKANCFIPNRVCKKTNGRGQISYRVQIGSVSLYKFISSVGLMPNKSKRLGKLKAPKKYFCHFLRGVIDGDGGIRHWLHPQNNREQWSLRITTASLGFANWLIFKIEVIMGAKGKLYGALAGKSNCYVLKYGKIAAQRIFKHCYKGDPALKLKRKAILAEKCCRSRSGWSKSKTVVH